MEKLEIEELIKHFITDIKKDEVTDILFNLISDIHGLEEHRELNFKENTIYINLNPSSEPKNEKIIEITEYLRPNKNLFLKSQIFIKQEIIKRTSTEIKIDRIVFNKE